MNLKGIGIVLALIIATALSEKQDKELNIYVNNIAPLDNPSETYKYYILPFLQPENEIKSDQTFSQSLSGDRLYLSPYNSTIGQNISGQSIGTKNYTRGELESFVEAIDNNFYAEFYVESFIVHDMIGVKVEKNDTTLFYLKNHIEFNVYLDESNPHEVIHSNITQNDSDDLIDVYYVSIPNFDGEEEVQEITFYYTINYYTVKLSDIDAEADVVFDQFNIDHDATENPEIHWFAIILSFLLVILLVLLVFLVLAKILKKDFSLSSDIESDQSVDIGWKLIRTEALMPPTQKLILSGFLGNGIQFLFLALNLIFFGILGMYYNSQKGNVKQVGVFLYSFTGIFNGYYSAKYYKFFGGKHWALNFIFSCGLFPVSLLLIFSIVNSYAWYKQSTSAIPAEAVFLVILIFLIIFVPLTLAGTITSRVKTTDILPNVDSSLPRLYKPIPERKVYQTTIVHFIIGGLLPFSSIYLELNQIFNSVWGHQTYHLYGTMCVAFILFLIVQACVSIGLTYYQLNAMDYNWWWKSFSYGGSTSLFLGLYVIYYYWQVSPMHGTLQFLMYFGYMVLYCSVLFMMLGSVSFLASMKFVRYIYNNSKMD